MGLSITIQSFPWTTQFPPADPLRDHGPHRLRIPVLGCTLEINKYNFVHAVLFYNIDSAKIIRNHFLFILFFRQYKNLYIISEIYISRYFIFVQHCPYPDFEQRSLDIFLHSSLWRRLSNMLHESYLNCYVTAT